MGYNELRTLRPQDIAALGVELDRNLRIARQRLVQLRTDPTVTRDQARTGVEFFAMVRDQNDEFTASIRGWLKWRTIPAGQVEEAKRLLRVISETNRLLVKLAVEARRIAETGPERPPLVLRIPIEDVPALTTATVDNIAFARQEFRRFVHAGHSSLPLFTREQLNETERRYRFALQLCEPYRYMYPKWRRAKLSALQRRQVSVLARRVREFRAVIAKGLALVESLRSRVPESFDDGLAGCLRGLVEDHPRM